MGRGYERSSADQLNVRVQQLQRAHPVKTFKGHDVCAAIHTALDVAETLLTSRDGRAFASPASESAESLLRELRAMGIVDATPQLVAMVALVDTAVDQLADASAAERKLVWEHLRKDVLRRHCSSPAPES